jgi:hypothetical protein
VFSNIVKTWVKQLSDFELKEVPMLEKNRDRCLTLLQRNDNEGMRAFFELEVSVSERGEMRYALESLELALKNSVATFARFDKKAAKDAQTLVEAKKRMGAPSFDDKDPILVTQRQAWTRAAQKLDFLRSELEKLRSALDYKYAGSTSNRELAALQEALSTDREHWEKPGANLIAHCYQALIVQADLHHLR